MIAQSGSKSFQKCLVTDTFDAVSCNISLPSNIINEDHVVFFFHSQHFQSQTNYLLQSLRYCQKPQTTLFYRNMELVHKIHHILLQLLSISHKLKANGQNRDLEHPRKN